MKLPYERIIIEADRLVMRAARSNSLTESEYCLKLYRFYLEACGWSEREFDEETIKRIDVNWDQDELLN